MTGRLYTCADCNGIFECAWSDEEAEAEYAEQFPGWDLRVAKMVCEDCYKFVMQAKELTDQEWK